MRLHRRPSGLINQGGLTLVELLIASTVLSVAILGVVGMWPVAYQHLRTGGDLTKATGLAQRIVEVLRDESFQVVSTLHDADTRHAFSSPEDHPPESVSFRVASSLQRWREEIAIATLGGGLGQAWGRIQVAPFDRGLLAITVTVGWPAPFAEQTVQLETYIAQQ